MTIEPKLLKTLQDVAETVDGLLDELRADVVAHRSDVKELCLGVALVLPRRLCAVSHLVVQNLGTEADAVARGLVEAAINLSWVGDSDERALAIQANGPRELLKMYRKMRCAGFEIKDDTLKHLGDEVEKITGDKPIKTPNIFERAIQSSLMSEVQATEMYRSAFVRESSVVHHDWTYICRVNDGIDLTGDMLHDTLAASMFILLAVAKAFDEPDALMSAVDQLQAAVQLSATSM